VQAYRAITMSSTNERRCLVIVLRSITSSEELRSLLFRSLAHLPCGPESKSPEKYRDQVRRERDVWSGKETREAFSVLTQLEQYGEELY